MPTAYINIKAASGGSDAANTLKTWNNLPVTAAATIADLLDDGGTATGWGVEVIDDASGSNTNGNSTTGSGDIAWLDEAVIMTNYALTSGATEYEVQLTGLDNGATYNIAATGSSGQSSSREFEMSTDGFSTSATCNVNLSNSTRQALLSGVSPSSGVIDLVFRTEASASASLIAAFYIEEVGGADVTAPVLTSPTATPTGVDGVDIGVTSDDTEGQLEGRIYTQGDAPTGTEVHTGTSNETIVASATSITSPVVGVNSFATITGLSPGNYVAKFAQDDTAGNISNAATEAVGANFTIAALVPTITDAGDEVFNVGETITITGTEFEAVQGTGSVVLSPTDDVNDAGAVTQTISTWTGDTSIDITIVKGSLNFDTNLYLFVTNDSGDTNAAGYVVQISPVVTIQETFTSLQGVDWASEAGLNVFVWRSVPAAAQDQLLLGQSLDASANSNWGITQGSLNANTPDPVWISVFKADGTALATSKKITPNYG